MDKKIKRIFKIWFFLLIFKTHWLDQRVFWEYFEKILKIIVKNETGFEIGNLLYFCCNLNSSEWKWTQKQTDLKPISIPIVTRFNRVSIICSKINNYWDIFNALKWTKLW